MKEAAAPAGRDSPRHAPEAGLPGIRSTQGIPALAGEVWRTSTEVRPRGRRLRPLFHALGRRKRRIPRALRSGSRRRRPQPPAGP